MNLPSRLLQLLMVVLMVGGASYLMMQSLPGDAAWRIAAGRYGYDALDAAAAASVRAELGLEAQGGLHFLYWLGDILRLELGTSLISGNRCGWRFVISWATPCRSPARHWASRC
ncbi:hypothetical protein ACU8V3_14235 [Cobetia marina]